MVFCHLPQRRVIERNDLDTLRRHIDRSIVPLLIRQDGIEPDDAALAENVEAFLSTFAIWNDDADHAAHYEEKFGGLVARLEQGLVILDEATLRIVEQLAQQILLLVLQVLDIVLADGYEVLAQLVIRVVDRHFDNNVPEIIILRQNVIKVLLWDDGHRTVGLGLDSVYGIAIEQALYFPDQCAFFQVSQSHPISTVVVLVDRAISSAGDEHSSVCFIKLLDNLLLRFKKVKDYLF